LHSVANGSPPLLFFLTKDERKKIIF